MNAPRCAALAEGEARFVAGGTPMTLRAADRRELAAAIADHFRTFDTICSATQERQDAVVTLLQEPLDVMVVVGGYNSSNTLSLAALCAQRVTTYHVEDALWRAESAMIQPRAATALVVCGMGGSAIGADLAVADLAERAADAEQLVLGGVGARDRLAVHRPVGEGARGGEADGAGLDRIDLERHAGEGAEDHGRGLPHDPGRHDRPRLERAARARQRVARPAGLDHLTIRVHLMTRTVHIIGAGLAGLTTAREIARRGWSVAVLEGHRIASSASSGSSPTIWLLP